MLPAIPMAQFHTIKRQIRGPGTRGALVAFTMSCAALAPFAAAQSSEPSPPAAAIAPSAAEFDLSNPDAAVKSFIAALNRADLITAARCVQGGANGGRSILTARFEQGHPHFATSGVNIAIEGEKATATIAELNVSVTASPKATAAEDKMKDEQLSLQREGTSWKIVSAKGKEFGRGARPQILEGIATMLTLNDTELSGVAEKADQSRCTNNLKQLALATQLYADKHEGRLDFTAETASQALLPLLEGNNKLFTGVEGKSRFVFNGRLSNASLQKIKDPAATVLFYEAISGDATAAIKKEGSGTVPTESGMLYFGYGGRANVAFADGHVQLVDQAEAAKLRWER